MSELIEKLTEAGLVHKGTDLGGLLQWAVLHLQAQEAALEKDCAAVSGAGRPYGKRPTKKLKFTRDQRIELLSIRFPNLAGAMK